MNWSFRSVGFRWVLPVLVVLGWGVLAQAASGDQPGSVVARGFTTADKGVVEGSLVATKADNSGAVELATPERAGRLAGVVIMSPLLGLSSGAGAQVQVTLSGTAPALVSDINGAIKAGDKITASPIEGVGMLATDDAQIVGTAGLAFDTNVAKAVSVTDKAGKRQTVHVGTVPLAVGVSYYVAPTNQFLPPFLQSLANSISGRPVSGARILLSGVVLLLAFGVVFALIYTAVRAGIVSLGRNPLAAGAIQRGLVNVGITVLLVIVLTLLGVYLILVY
ncbi:MAG TPA: hypothetical protein VMT30_07490 [Candidatus Saccharimonadia bacterium]|nr:hypothetical protein [Candidatus Saccharimonadia bacterium]